MPKIVDHQQRQQELAKAAFETVLKLGMANTTMRSLADTAHCSTGTLVHYFQDKDDILEAALNYAHDRTGERMRSIIAKNESNLLFRIAEQALPVAAKQREEWKVWVEFWGQAMNVPALKAINKQRYKEWITALERIIRLGIDARELKKDLAVEKEAATIGALIDGLGLQATLDPQRVTATLQRTTLQNHIAHLRPSQ